MAIVTLNYGPAICWVIGDILLHGDTYGMRQCNMKLVKLDAQLVSRMGSIVHLLVTLCACPLAPISLVLVLKTGRSLPDLLCRTVVTKSV